MSETKLIKTAFWNLQNLFGTYKNYIAFIMLDALCQISKS